MTTTTKDRDMTPLINQLADEIAKRLTPAAQTDRRREHWRGAPTNVSASTVGGRSTKVYQPTRRIDRRQLDKLIPIERQVMDYLLANPNTTAKEITAATDMNPKSVESALWRLRRVWELVRSVDRN